MLSLMGAAYQMTRRATKHFGTLGGMQFDHVGVLVSDLEAAKTFARDVLGLGDPVAEFEAAEHGGLAGSFFSLGEGRLELFKLDTPGERLPDGAQARIDHVAVRVEDLDAERDRLAAGGVTFTGPSTPDPVTDPIELRGARHLWTDPATSGGYSLQLIEPAKSD
jgi:catechol 2,3-dioxygenase-like lactoylglutathione lyase family enzyme